MVLEGAEMDAVLRCVERGLGVAVVPAMVLVDRPRTALGAALRTPARTLDAVWPTANDVTLTRAAQAMQRMIIDTANVLSSSNAATDALITRAS